MPAPASGGSQGPLGRGRTSPASTPDPNPCDLPPFLWVTKLLRVGWLLPLPSSRPFEIRLKQIWVSWGWREKWEGGHRSETLRKASPCLARAMAQAALQTHLSPRAVSGGKPSPRESSLCSISPLLPAGNVGRSFTPVSRLWVRSQAFGSPDVPWVSFPRLGPCPVPVLGCCLSTRLPLALGSTAWSQYCRDNKKHKALVHTHTSC